MSGCTLCGIVCGGGTGQAPNGPAADSASSGFRSLDFSPPPNERRASHISRRTLARQAGFNTTFPYSIVPGGVVVRVVHGFLPAGLGQGGYLGDNVAVPGLAGEVQTSGHLQEAAFVLRLHDDYFVCPQNIADSHRARLVAFQAPLGDGLEGPLKGFGHALLLVNVQSRVTDSIAVPAGGGSG